MKSRQIKPYFISSVAAALLVAGIALPYGNAPSAAAAAAQTAAVPAILLDGYSLPFPAPPAVKSGTTMVPFRAVAEALHITVQWDAKARTVTATKAMSGGGTRKVVLKQGSKQATVDGKAVTLAVAPYAQNGSVLVPLSFFSSQFGAAVSWNGATKTVSIQSPAEDMDTSVFYALNSFAKRSYMPLFDGVSFGWARIGEDGRLTLEGKDYYWPEAAGDITPESLVEGAEAAGQDAQLLVVGTDGAGELTRLLGDPTLRAAAISDIVSLASGKHFTGITLDFEGLGLTGDAQAVQQSLNTFVKDASAAARQAGLRLSLALHPLNGSYKGYDYKTLGSYADELIIMAYDFKQEPGPEPLGSIDTAIKLALQQVDKSKLVLGISLGSENAQSLRGPVGLAKRYDLKGIAIWRLTLVSDEIVNALKQNVILN
ncbi:stalk domain-containing protein [Paenibacillus physcomitrellae]|uniref:stalk domain-containing protein n=1 Tax=Paenibacillus physcomitrellae TaxID=1619311 RepID=UPI001E579383|nr:stalk domain-containing protein [Paenibacillus physcomitrellae]